MDKMKWESDFTYLLSDLIINSVKTSWFWTILKAATVATPPAPIISTLLIYNLVFYYYVYYFFYKFIYLEAFQRFSFYFISLAEMPRAFISE